MPEQAGDFQEDNSLFLHQKAKTFFLMYVCVWLPRAFTVAGALP